MSAVSWASRCTWIFWASITLARISAAWASVGAVSVPGRPEVTLSVIRRVLPSGYLIS